MVKQHKKKNNVYYYYYCCDCKCTIGENEIETFIKNFINDIVEYDSIVNQFFLPMIKQKINNPKDELEKELKEQKAKIDRIKKAYVNGTFTLEDCNSMSKPIEKKIEELEYKINQTEICDELKFTPEDILLKRDIDFINKNKFPEEYKKYNKSWNDLTRKEKADLIMGYIDEITLTAIGDEYVVDFVKFRESICKPMSELYDNGYIDRKIQTMFGNVVGFFRYSEYLPADKIGEHIARLRHFYNVGYYEAKYSTIEQGICFNFIEDNKAIIRIFPLEDYRKTDPNIEKEIYNLGVLFIREDDKFIPVDKDIAFKYIPDVYKSVIHSNETTKLKVKPVAYYEETNNEEN